MKCEPDTKLIERLQSAGISRRMLVSELNTPYGTISCWLRGFSPMPTRARLQINNLIGQRLRAETDLKKSENGIQFLEGLEK